MISDPKNLSEQLCNLSERLGIEMRTLNRTKVSTVNGVAPDSDGNVTIQTGGDTSNLVPKTGNRGLLAGFEVSDVPPVNEDDLLANTYIVNESSPDAVLIQLLISLTVEDGQVMEDGETTGTSWTKVIVYGSSPMFPASITLGESWVWAGGESPTLASFGIIVLHWNTFIGVAQHITVMD